MKDGKMHVRENRTAAPHPANRDKYRRQMGQ
jgi:hypothetical protein